MATSLEVKNSIKRNLSDLIGRTGNWHYLSRNSEVDNAKEVIGELILIVDRLLNIVQVPFDTTEIEPKEIPLKAAPFQPECKCEIVQNGDGILTIYYCQYHRSITYVYDELNGLITTDKIMRREFTAFGRQSIVDLLSFLDKCKKNSLTGEIGKARDENVGR